MREQVFELRKNHRAQAVVERMHASRNESSRKNIEVSVSGSLEKVYEFYPVVLEEIPQAQQMRIDPQRGMVYKIPAGKQTKFEELARQHGLELIGAGGVMA